MGARGGQEITGRQKLEGLGRGDAARQGHGRGGTEETKVDPVDAEAGVLGRDDEVAGTGKLATGGGRDALHRGDDGLGQGGQRLHHAGAEVEEAGNLGLAAIGRGAGGLDLFQVMAGREGAPLGPQDHDADGAVCRDVGQGRTEGRQAWPATARSGTAVR